MVVGRSCVTWLEMVWRDQIEHLDTTQNEVSLSMGNDQRRIKDGKVWCGSHERLKLPLQHRLHAVENKQITFKKETQNLSVPQKVWTVLYFLLQLFIFLSFLFTSRNCYCIAGRLCCKVYCLFVCLSVFVVVVVVVQARKTTRKQLCLYNFSKYKFMSRSAVA